MRHGSDAQERVSETITRHVPAHVLGALTDAGGYTGAGASAMGSESP